MSTRRQGVANRKTGSSQRRGQSNLLHLQRLRRLLWIQREHSPVHKHQARNQKQPRKRKPDRKQRPKPARNQRLRSNRIRDGLTGAVRLARRMRHAAETNGHFASQAPRPTVDTEVAHHQAAEHRNRVTGLPGQPGHSAKWAHHQGVLARAP